MKRANAASAASVAPPKFDLVAASGPAATAAAAAAASSAPSSVVARFPPKGLPRVGVNNGNSNKIGTGGADNELAAALARRRGAIGE